MLVVTARVRSPGGRPAPPAFPAPRGRHGLASPWPVATAAASASRGRRRMAPGLALAAALAALATGCATYTDKVSGAHMAASGGDYASAISAMNGLLGVASADQIPSSLSGDKPLYLLDRGTLQQAVASFPGSQNDFQTAEQRLEVLDISRDGIATLGGYLYSDSAKTYKIPPAERLSLSALNLLNYIARGDLQGAAVEARRFQVSRDYFSTIGARSPQPDRIGAYLAGFVFEQLGENDRALRYYDEALGGGGLATLAMPVARLARISPYRGQNITGMLGGAGGPGGGAAKAASPSGAIAKQPELLVVMALGRVPHRVPQRMPVGAAVGIAGAMLGDRDLDVLRYSATKVLVYPDIVPTPTTIGSVAVTVNGRPAPIDTLGSIGQAVWDEYQASRPKILAAALTRVAARAAVAEGARAAGNQQSGDLGTVVALVAEATMVALDKPDTRSWTMLPERVLVARVPVAPGVQDVRVAFDGGGTGRNVKIDVPPGGFGAVVVTEPR